MHHLVARHNQKGEARNSLLHGSPQLSREAQPVRDLQHNDNSVACMEMQY